MRLSHSLIGLVLIVAFSLLVYVFERQENADSPEIAFSAAITAGAQVNRATTPPRSEFSAAELRTTLTDVCSSATTYPTEKEWTQEEVQGQIEAFQKQKLRLSQNLSASTSVEHLHVAALLEEDPASRFELFDNAISRSPSDPLLVWDAVQKCSMAAESMPCPLRDWERLLIAVDGQNSESWVRLAANRYAANQLGAALEAMRYASTAAESRVYWTETVEMIERGLAAGTDYAFPERASMAFSFAASALPPYGDYVEMCEERSAQSVDWAYACLAYGELVENQGKTEMGVSIARSIQRLALEGLGELERAADVQQRLDARRQERLNWIKDYDPAIERLIFSNPTLFSAYLAAIRSVGEEVAQRQISIEIEQLFQQQPNLACEQLMGR